MASLPYPPDTASTCTAPHVDGCPSCVVNTEAAQHVDRQAHGCLAYYLCAACGHSWTTEYRRCG